LFSLCRRYFYTNYSLLFFSLLFSCASGTSCSDSEEGTVSSGSLHLGINRHAETDPVVQHLLQASSSGTFSRVHIVAEATRSKCKSIVYP
jgi:hypothetical protein